MSLKDVNSRLAVSYKYKRNIKENPDKFPLSKLKENFKEFFKRELMFERAHYKKFYGSQGFLGRLLLCMIDKITFTTSSALLSESQIQNNFVSTDKRTKISIESDLREA